MPAQTRYCSPVEYDHAVQQKSRVFLKGCRGGDRSRRACSRRRLRRSSTQRCGDNQVLVERIGMGRDLDPFAAAGDDRQHCASGRDDPNIMLQLRHVFRCFFRERVMLFDAFAG